MIVLLTVKAAHAQYGMAGCGLGSLLFGTDNTKLMQILAATTNGTFGSTTFGITSGTSNCVEGGVVKAQREQAAFAEVNFLDLKKNMAMGGGEFLASFSTLLGCEDAAKPAFFKMTQTKYESILPSESTTPMGMLSSLKLQMKADPTLAKSCSDERAIARATGKQAAPPAPTNVAMAKPATAPVAK
jgi:hypothetical protein